MMPAVPPAAPHRRWAAPAALVVIAVLATMAVAMMLSTRVISSIDQARMLVMHASARAEAVRQVMDAMKDAETGQRGYLLTLEPAYLEPYSDGRARVAPALATLEALAADTPELGEDVAATRRLVGEELAELDRTVAAARERGRDAALAIVLTDAGKANMDAIRRHVAGMLREIGMHHDVLLGRVRDAERLSARLGALAAGLSAFLLGVVALVLLRGRRQLEIAQDLLAAQGLRLAGTIDNLRDGVAVFDAAGALLLWNAQFAEQSALSPELIRVGTPVARIAAAAWPGTTLADPTRTATVVEIRRDPDMFEIWRSPMPDGGQILVVTDITRRSHAEAIARQAQKMEALGQLTGGVSHDFNNLLQVVSANLELIGARMGADTWLSARLTAALAAVERAARLTRHLLAFARRQPLAPEAIDTRRLLGGLDDMLRRTLGESVTLEVVLGGGLWSIRADPQQMENAILNLAINARDAMPEGGRLIIEASNVALDDMCAPGNADFVEGQFGGGQYVAIAVTDTGVGMTAEELDRAIEPFYTTKPEGRGTGLGLPMVFGFAKQSGGHFKLQSEPGRGTSARLYLPRSATAPLVPLETQDAARAAHGELVLVVEDDPTVRAASTQALRGLGYRTIEAPDAAAALVLLREGTRPDMLFTDIVMPGKPDARTMAREAQAMVPGLAVVFTSGYADDVVARDGELDAGIILVSKPWRVAELARRLRQAIEAARGPVERPRRLRILLAEDEALVRMTTADLLADMGHEVTEAETAAEAMQQIAMRASGGLDILVTDLGLPDMDGLELAARALDQVPGLRVVIASGREADASSTHVWLEKPFDYPALRAAIERAAPPAEAQVIRFASWTGAGA